MKPADNIRTLVRPFVVTVLTLAMVGFVAFGLPIPDKLWEAYFVVLTFWFVSRVKVQP